MPYLKINGVKMAVETFGNMDNPPLILLEGDATKKEGRHVWEYNNTVGRLSKDFYVITYDRRGHGTTPFSGSLDDQARDVIALMDALCLETANVVGMSAGTYILGRAAALAPERFKSLILMVPHSHAEGVSPATVMFQKLNINMATATPEEMSAPFWAPCTTAEFISEYNDFFKTFDSIPNIPPEQTAAAYKAIGTFDNRPVYADLKLPTLVCSGKYDQCNPPEVGQEIAKLIDGGRYVEFDRSAHMLFYEQNEEFVDCVLDFLHSVQ